ncbi:ABC transporter permease [Luteococcus sp. H138]|uniref:ABC transporter permease n=1 Tax=unclassified Luteococcus TaxID=2639923 RepID=UPI00313AAE37
MRELTSLSLRLLRRHLPLYLGCMTTMAATAIIAAAQLGLVYGFSSVDRVNVPDMDAQQLASTLPAITGFLSFLAGLAIIISGLLMWSAVKQVVSFRQQELATLRLAGASRGRLASMIATECFALGTAVGLPSSVIGLILVQPLFGGLQAIGFFGRNMSVDFGLPLDRALLITLMIALVAALAGHGATRSATSGELVHAISPMPARMSYWQVAWRLTVLGAGIAGLALLSPQRLGPNIVLMLPLLAVVPLLAVAPLVMPAGAWLVGRLVGTFAAGPGLLAARRASKDRIRYARLVTPTIIAIGMLGAFLVANAPDEQMRQQALSARLAADTIVTATSPAGADRVAEALTGRTSGQARLAMHYRPTDETRLMWHFTDAPAFARLTRQHIREGDLTKVSGTDIASSIGHHVGDRITTTTNAGKPVSLRVVATLERDELYEGLFLDWRQISNFGPTGATPSTVFTTGMPPAQVTATLAAAGNPEGTVFGPHSYVKHQNDVRKATTYRSNVGLFGTVYLMCGIGIVQTTIASGMSRQKEFRVLRSLGISRHGIYATVVTETIILQGVAGTLILAVITALGLRFAATNSTSPSSAIAAALPITELASAAITFVTILAQLCGVRLGLDQDGA